jgi:hypothetical protein
MVIDILILIYLNNYLIKMGILYNVDVLIIINFDIVIILYLYVYVY